MKKPNQRPDYYDVTTKLRDGEAPPPHAGKRTLRESLWRFVTWPLSFVADVVAPKFFLWLRRPITLVGILLLTAAGIGSVRALRMRPPEIDGPALPMTGWKAAAFQQGVNKQDPHSTKLRAAIDGDAQTRWESPQGQRNTAWFAVDMGKRQVFHQIVMDCGANTNDYLRGYAVYASSDGVHWGVPIASGESESSPTIVTFARQTARWIKVVPAGANPNNPWSIAEFTVH